MEKAGCRPGQISVNWGVRVYMRGGLEMHDACHSCHQLPLVVGP
jgi:hypothetical protein